MIPIKTSCSTNANTRPRKQLEGRRLRTDPSQYPMYVAYSHGPGRKIWLTPFVIIEIELSLFRWDQAVNVQQKSASRTEKSYVSILQAQHQLQGPFFEGKLLPFNRATRLSYSTELHNAGICCLFEHDNLR